MKSRSVLMLVAAVVIVFSAVASGDQFRMRAGESNPAAMGIIHANTDRNGNMLIELEAKHLAPPDRLTPPHTVYVVWAQAAGKPPEVIGQLRVNAQDMAASFKTSVPYHNFDIFVTAEDNAKPDSPSGAEVLRGSIQK
jgi:hypothetical protein